MVDVHFSMVDGTRWYGERMEMGRGEDMDMVRSEAIESSWVICEAEIWVRREQFTVVDSITVDISSVGDVLEMVRQWLRLPKSKAEPEPLSALLFPNTTTTETRDSRLKTCTKQKTPAAIICYAMAMQLA